MTSRIDREGLNPRNIYYVFQGKTHDYESQGGYLWSPQRNNSGGRNKGYETMRKVRKGDIIFHGSNAQTYAISIAESDCYESQQPEANKRASGDTVWDNEGYRIDSDYTIFKSPLKMQDHYHWLAENYDKDSAFNVNGQGKQTYLSELSDEHAEYILLELLKLDQDEESSKLIESILEEVFKYATYPIGEHKVRDKNKVFEKSGDPVENALRLSNYLCEYDKDHKVFISEDSNKNFTKAHYLIPLKYQEKFDGNLNIEENIISLCSYCYDLLRYGRFEDKSIILDKLYKERKYALKSRRIKLENLEQLEKYY